MCNVTQGKAEQEVYCYREAIKNTQNFGELKKNIIDLCGKHTDWGAELDCIVRTVEQAR
ncbi:MAG: hypothetical protein WBA93_03135 [Microcoleaceae cyanobacterium]